MSDGITDAYKKGPATPVKNGTGIGFYGSPNTSIRGYDSIKPEPAVGKYIKELENYIYKAAGIKSELIKSDSTACHCPLDTIMAVGCKCGGK